MGAILALLLPAIPGIIGIVEKIFGKGGGPEKANSVLTQILAMINDLVAAGKIPKGSTIDQSALQGQIETIVQMLNKAGLLNGTDTDITAIIKALQPLIGGGTPVVPISPVTDLAGQILRVVVIK
jgi:hypothetical protein